MPVFLFLVEPGKRRTELTFWNAFAWNYHSIPFLHIEMASGAMAKRSFCFGDFVRQLENLR